MSLKSPQWTYKVSMQRGEVGYLHEEVMSGEALEGIGVDGEGVGHVARQTNSQVATHDEDGGGQDHCQHPDHLPGPGSGGESHPAGCKLCRAAHPH